MQNNGNLDAKVAIGLLVKVFDATIGVADDAEKVEFVMEFSKTKLLIDGENKDATITLTVTLNATADNTGVIVHIGSTSLTTFYYDKPLAIPFDTYDGLLSVSYVKAADNDVAEMKALRQYIPANTGVVINGNSGDYLFKVAKVAETELPDASDNMLKGVLANTSLDEVRSIYNGQNIYTLQPDETYYFSFKKFTGTTLGGNKAFLPLASSASAKAFRIVFDEATGITSIKGGGEAYGSWYTIGGTRLDKKPTQRGIYIHNGKKVIVK